MRCLYDVLEVEPTADGATVRTAYRKAALKWHPDKNQDNPEAAVERFKEIQNAYEILSDPHERAWFDSHRDAILRSGERHQAGYTGGGYARGERPADDIDLYAYFTSTCYSGFGDGKRGFYAVYDELFQQLAKQEAAAQAARAERRDASPSSPLPRFGASAAPWAKVAAFYAEWGSFATAKEFSWADQYNPASAPSRKVRRAMEQENEKARRAVRREYNDGVRELVAFLRKRDKRVVVHQVEEARRRQERQDAEAARREAERQERMARAAAYQDEWESASVGGEGSGSEEEAEEEDILVLYCVACEKHFKCEAAFANHERSKKHKERVQLLRDALERDEQLTGIAEKEEEEHAAIAAEDDGMGQVDGASSGPGSSAGHGGAASSTSASASSSSSSVAASDEGLNSDEDSSNSSSAGGTLDEDLMLTQLMNLRGVRGISSPEQSYSSEDEKVVLERMTSSQQAVQNSQDSAVEQQWEDAEVVADTRPAGLGDAAAGSNGDDWGTGQGVKRRGKARRAPAGGGTAADPQQQQQPSPAAHQVRKGKGKKASARSGDASAAAYSELACSICGESFTSRNQLFKHVKMSGHAVVKRA